MDVLRNPCIRKKILNPNDASNLFRKKTSFKNRQIEYWFCRPKKYHLRNKIEFETPPCFPTPIVRIVGVPAFLLRMIMGVRGMGAKSLWLSSQKFYTIAVYAGEKKEAPGKSSGEKIGVCPPHLHLLACNEFLIKTLLLNTEVSGQFCQLEWWRMKIRLEPTPQGFGKTPSPSLHPAPTGSQRRANWSASWGEHVVVFSLKSTSPSAP